jgi:SAM-dependent methyltransferase
LSESGNARAQRARELSEDGLVAFCGEIFPGESRYELFVNEARFGLSRLLPVLESLDAARLDILEVGAGSCLLAAYLASRGLRVTAVEPLGAEFGFFIDQQQRALEFCQRKEIPLTVLRQAGEELEILERFDIAYTINALEHMPDPLLTVDNMYRSLRPGGLLLAHCPNYTVPLEVHFNILLLTRSKRINEWLYRSRIARDSGVWRGLTFIRHIDVRRHLQSRCWRFLFDRSVMHDAFRRLVDDPIFARRMPPPLRALGAFLCHTNLVRVTRLLPARLQTPMEVLVMKPLAPTGSHARRPG